MAKMLFITGTGTDVGKTYVSGMFVKKLRELNVRTAYYKCAASGNRRDETGTLIPGDASWVKEFSGIEQDVSTMGSYVYEVAASPHLASRLEGNPVQTDVVKRDVDYLFRQYDYVVVEGSGGIVCPIVLEENKILLEDLVRELNLSCLVVANAGLGVINDVALTVSYMRSKRIPVRGVVFNQYTPGDFIEEDNIVVCEQITGVPVVCCVRKDAVDLDIEPDALKDLFLE